MKYLTFIRHSESYRQSGPPAALMEAMGKFVEKSLKDGILVDTIECKLNPYGPAIDRAITYSFIPTDIDGVTRPTGKSADIGAREFPDPAAIIYPKQGVLQKKWTVIGLGSALIAIILIVSAKKARKKLHDSTYKLESQRPNIG
jgi:hypothetical protein